MPIAHRTNYLYIPTLTAPKMPVGATHRGLREKVGCIMRRIKLVIVVATVIVATLITSALPAMASSQEDSIVFFPVPGGNGATYSCAGGPPFVFDPASTGNCAVQRIGMADDLVCDVPTTITFVHDMHRYVADGSLCKSDTGESGGSSPGADLPT